MQADPDQFLNLASHSSQSEVVDNFRQQLEKHVRVYGTGKAQRRQRK